MHKGVLIVDDDALIRKVSARTLTAAGFDVTVVGAARDALEQIGAGRFDVAIIDYYLGAECGCDLIRPLRARNRSIRIVVVSGLGMLPDLVRHAHRAGADHVACKTQIDWHALASSEVSAATASATSATELSAFKRAFVHGAYLVHRRNMSSTARALGITRTGLQRMLRQNPPDWVE